jgi:fluoride exporter
MGKYAFIAAGGLMGALCRYALKNLTLFDYKGSFPLNTFIINLSGSLLLAFFLSVTLEAVRVDTNLKFGVSTGFFGAYTTFSAFCREIFVLMQQRQYIPALAYLGLSLLLGLAAAWLGQLLGTRVSRKTKAFILKKKVGIIPQDPELREPEEEV